MPAGWARGRLRAAIIALNDAIDSITTFDLIVETREEIERREQALLECQHPTRQFGSLTRLAESHRARTDEREQHRGQDSRNTGYGNRSDGRHVL